MKEIAIAGLLMLLSIDQGAAWETTQEKSPIDDSRTVHIIKEANTLYQNRYGRSGRANMQILCEQNRTGLAIVLPELYTSDHAGLGHVTFRVDKRVAFEIELVASNDHSLLAIVGGPAIKAIKKMMGGQTLLAQVMAVSEPSHLIQFDITDIDLALTPVREACAW